MTQFRKYGRSALPGKVKVKHRELGEFYADDGDISATGLFLKIRCIDVLSIGDELAAELPKVVNEPLGKARLRVVRVTSEGIGLTFM